MASPVLLAPPGSSLFPYTTLFRSKVPATPRIRPRCSGVPVYVQVDRSEEHTSELQSPYDLVCRLLLEKKKKKYQSTPNPRSTRVTHAVRNTGCPACPTQLA